MAYLNLHLTAKVEVTDNMSFQNTLVFSCIEKVNQEFIKDQIDFTSSVYLSYSILLYSILCMKMELEIMSHM